MIVDLSRVHLGRVVEDGALWVVEQIPGLVEYADTTPILRTGGYIVISSLTNTCIYL